MVRFPDPKQYENNWKNDKSLFPSCDQLGEIVRAATTLLGSPGMVPVLSLITNDVNIASLLYIVKDYQ